MALIGFESMDQELLNSCNKNTTISQNIKARRILLDANILTFGYFLIGIPGETSQMRKKTIRLIETLSDMPLLQQYVPYFKEAFENAERKPNYPFYMKHKKPNFIVDTQHIDQTAQNKDDLNNIQEITKDLRKFFVRMFLNPLYIFDVIGARSPIQKTKKEIILFMYKNLIKGVLRFNPHHFLYWIRGR